MPNIKKISTGKVCQNPGSGKSPVAKKPAKVKITSNKKPLGGKHENLLKK